MDGGAAQETEMLYPVEMTHDSSRAVLSYYHDSANMTVVIVILLSTM